MALSVFSAVVVLGLFVGCKKTKTTNETETEAAEDARPSANAWNGTWRAVLRSPGGPLPFGLRLRADGAKASIINGPETIELEAKVVGETLTISFPVYDATIVANKREDGTLEGEWMKTTPSGSSRLPFEASRGSKPRFALLGSADGTSDPATPSVSGRWSVTFSDNDGSFPAVGEFAQDNKAVTGTFLTETGDYRFLAGSFERGVLRLSTFDGAHAFLFRGVAKDGELRGTFTSRDSYQATFVAKRATKDQVVLGDPRREVQVTSADRKVRFSFSDWRGKIVSSSDERFAGKVVVIDIFGTWCPNCNDEAPLLARLHREHRGRGLEVVGLAFEFTGKPERDRTMLKRFAAKHDIEYPLLLAGVSDKAKASAVLPDLSGIKSYPTTIFVGRDGRVASIHSGFSGPGTGEHHNAVVTEFENTIEELLSKGAR